MTRKFPARIHVLLASKAPLGVVFRRGPANAVCTVGWNRASDHFELGQWLRGRIYERRADLSPDGRPPLSSAPARRADPPPAPAAAAVTRSPEVPGPPSPARPGCTRSRFTAKATAGKAGACSPR